MSKGYIPKRRAQIRKNRKLRKKYKNFSCETCAKRHFADCKKRFIPTPPIGLIVSSYENCNEWKADKEPRLKIETTLKKRRSFKQVLERIF